jgi:hypothetical protein
MRFSSLFTGVKAKIFDQFPDETWVYPGHGNDTTLGAERPHLEEWRAGGWLGDASSGERRVGYPDVHVVCGFRRGRCQWPGVRARRWGRPGGMARCGR